MGHRLVKDDSPGSIGPTRTGVRVAALTDRGGGASSIEQSDDERWARGKCGSLHPCLDHAMEGSGAGGGVQVPVPSSGSLP